MSAGEFMERFGASCRTKHLIPLPVRRRTWAQLAWNIARSRVNLVDRRIHALPPRSELPREFIRLDPWEADYLYAIASLARHGIVEIGRLHGGSTFLLACANMKVPIWSIDISPRDDPRLAQLFETHGIGHNVELLVGDSHDDPFPEIGTFDVLFIDGNHSYSGCTADLHAFVPRLAPGGHVVLHDSYTGRPVQRAILDFLADHDVDVVRSPYIPAAHWHTSYGSLAHLRKPGRTEPPAEEPAAPTPPAQRVAPRPRHRVRLPAALATLAAVLAAIFLLLPEAFGDWPYNPIGHSSKAHAHTHALRAPAHQT